MTAPDFLSFKEALKQARLRLLTMHFGSGVGHIGGNLSSLDALMVLFHYFKGPRDEILLSKGHSAGALYVALQSTGAFEESELKTFHEDGTRLAGHPPPKGLPGVPFATGSLGHGLSLAAGLALGKRLTENSGRVFCLTSDGEWQEGSTWEALIFSAHQKLKNLTVLIDANGLQGFGTTGETASLPDLAPKIRPFDVELVEIDGHDVCAIYEACQTTGEKPKVIVLKTVKGKGVSFMENKMEWHYLPLTKTLYHQAIAEVEKA
jgi:transketolase